MIDIVLPYLYCNKATELRFCLRSIAKHLTGVGNIFIIGDCPEWVQGVIHIPHESSGGNIRHKDRDIFSKIMIACNDPRVSDNFLFMNDDHFLLSDYEASEFPYYYHGVFFYNAAKAEGLYKETLENTKSILQPWSSDFDEHCPIVYNKAKFIKALSDLDWKKLYGYAIKSVYCHRNGIEGQFMDDCKIRLPMVYGELQWAIDGRKWFSIADKVINDDMKQLLNDLYSEPSIYEFVKQTSQ